MSDAFADAFAGFLADPTVAALGGAIGAALVALWIAAAWWAYTDAARRTESTLAALIVAGWIIVSTPLLVPFSLAIYSLARPGQTAADARTRHLAGALVDAMEASMAGGCTACGLGVEPGWLRCPRCTTWLALPCTGCGTWSDSSLDACPFCGSEERDEPAVVPPEPPTALPGRARRSRRAIRAIGPGSPSAHRGGRRPLLTADGRPLVPARGR
jgi:hypothetical protein